jgi:hypothetical protein
MINRKLKIQILAVFTSLALLGTLSLSSAYAVSKSKNLSASNLVTISYQLSVTIPKSGCGKIPVKYKINKLPMEGSAFFVVIEDDQDRLIGQAEWFGEDYEGSVKAMPKAGTFNIKLCRSMWTDSDETTFYPAYKGTYTIYLSAVGDMSADAKGSFKLS